MINESKQTTSTTEAQIQMLDNLNNAITCGQRIYDTPYSSAYSKSIKGALTDLREYIYAYDYKSSELASMTYVQLLETVHSAAYTCMVSATQICSAIAHELEHAVVAADSDPEQISMPEAKTA